MRLEKTVICMILVFMSISVLNAVHSDPGNSYCKKNRLCSANQHWDRRNIEDVERAPCFCDDYCTDFGDCCIDSSNMKEIQRKQGFICASEGLAEPFYLYQMCPLDTHIVLKTLCEKPNKQDPFTLLPTTSLLTNITYRNSFCAVCNNEEVEYLKLWNPILSCSTTDGNTLQLEVTSLRTFTYYNSKSGQWEYKPLDEFMTPVTTNIICETSFSLAPISVRKNIIKKCKPNMNSCNSKWKDTSMEDKCNTYTAYVYSNNSITYKNIYCAVCNMMEIDELACDPRDTTYKLRNVEIQNILSDLYLRGQYLICRTVDYYAKHPIHPPCPPGTLLQNVGFETVCLPEKFPIPGSIDRHSVFGGNICTLNFVIPTGNNQRYSSQHCAARNVYDPFIRQCRIVTQIDSKSTLREIAATKPLSGSNKK